MSRKENEETKTFLARLRENAKKKVEEKGKIYVEPEQLIRREDKGKAGLFQEGGQFAPQQNTFHLEARVRSMRRGYGWSEKTILEREKIKEEEIKGYDDIVTEILFTGHAVKTRAVNTCLNCNRETGAGEIVLGVVERGFEGSDRYYICNDCARKLSLIGETEK